MIYGLIYSRDNIYLHYFIVCILAPYTFCLSYCQIMIKFLIKAAFGGETLIRERHLICCCQLVQHVVRKKCPCSELFWSGFSRIWIEYGEVQSISPYSVRLRKIQTRKTPNTGTFHAMTRLRPDACKRNSGKTQFGQYSQQKPK